ncbi:hypothetical protein HJG60_011823 [Phyllostomus discolor]|uniref:Uncharacterized protein n=1 Tax=Phyllostomus discolor TaxID=89673 RepID=A0A834DVZ0_9CHIR|nr:hypothetical protein HJG60_011823 [Phyllostomus discolor]
MILCPLVGGVGSYKSKSNTSPSRESSTQCSHHLPLLQPLTLTFSPEWPRQKSCQHPTLDLPSFWVSTFPAFVLAHRLCGFTLIPPFSAPPPTRAFCGRQMGCLQWKRLWALRRFGWAAPSPSPTTPPLPT